MQHLIQNVKFAGLRFGLLQVKIALIILLSNYEFSLNSITSIPLNFEPLSFILAPHNGIYLNTKRLK